MKRDFDNYATFDSQNLDEDLSNLADTSPLDDLTPELKGAQQKSLRSIRCSIKTQWVQWPEIHLCLMTLIIHAEKNPLTLV